MGTIPEELYLARDRRERIAREAADAALAARLDDALSDLEERFSKLEAKTKALLNGRDVDSSALISTMERVLTRPGFALAERIDTLEATVTDGATTSAAFIEEISRVIATTEYALAEKITHLHAQIDNFEGGISEADVNTILTAYATQTFAEAKRDEAITASQGYTDAEVSNVATAYAAADSALASDISTVSATVGDVSAAVTTETSARIAADGAIQAHWGVRLDVDGRVIGRIQLDGTGGTSTLDFDAGAIRMWNGTSDVAPFALTGGTLELQNLRVGGLVVNSTSLQSTNVTIHSAYANGISVGSGGDYAHVRQSPTGLPGFILDDGGTIKGTFNLVNVGAGIVRSVLEVDAVNVNFGVAAQTLTVGSQGVVKINGLGRFALESAFGQSIVFTTTGTERWIVGGSDGHLKSMGSGYDIRKASSDGWSVPHFDGSNHIEFRYDSGQLQARIDFSTIVTFTVV